MKPAPKLITLADRGDSRSASGIYYYGALVLMMIHLPGGHTQLGSSTPFFNLVELLRTHTGDAIRPNCRYVRYSTYCTVRS